MSGFVIYNLTLRHWDKFS